MGSGGGVSWSISSKRSCTFQVTNRTELAPTADPEGAGEGAQARSASRMNASERGMNQAPLQRARHRPRPRSPRFRRPTRDLVSVRRSPSGTARRPTATATAVDAVEITAAADRGRDRSLGAERGRTPRTGTLTPAVPFGRSAPTPSSRGPGRSSLRVETGVRIPVGSKLYERRGRRCAQPPTPFSMA